MRDSTVMWGEVVGAEFQPDDVTDGRIVVRVAVDPNHSVGHRRVVVIDGDYYESTLPTVDDIKGVVS